MTKALTKKNNNNKKILMGIRTNHKTKEKETLALFLPNRRIKLHTNK